MKKMILVIATFLSFVVAANAEIPSKCPKWEHGQAVYYNGVQQNIPASTAPPAFCWDIVQIETGFGIYNGTRYESETLVNDTSAADWFAFAQRSVYGEMHFGSYVTVTVHGFPQDEPTVKIGSKIGILTNTVNIKSNSGSILNGKEYTFFIRHIPTSQATYMSDLDIHDNIEVYDGATLKDVTFIQ